MQGFVNLATDLGYAISVLLPVLCYLVGAGILIASLWGLFQLARGHLRERMWTPFVGIFIASALFSFDKLLNAANGTVGSNHTASISGLTSYTPTTVNPSTMMGATPQSTLLNIINTFDLFFAAYGAAIVFWSLMELHAISKGNRRNGPGRALIHFTFGVALININVIAAAVMNYFA